MTDKDKAKLVSTEKRKANDQETEPIKDLKKVSLSFSFGFLMKFSILNFTSITPLNP